MEFLLNTVPPSHTQELQDMRVGWLWSLLGAQYVPCGFLHMPVLHFCLGVRMSGLVVVGQEERRRAAPSDILF